jgi:DNA-binding NarL/FixJ family response regulator
LAICDVDFGDVDKDGMSLVHEIRQRAPNVFICMHTNHSSTEAYRAAMAAGSNALLPKPMSVPHLCDLLSRAAQSSRDVHV